jgi:hypothetical protein
LRTAVGGYMLGFPGAGPIFISDSSNLCSSHYISATKFFYFFLSVQKIQSGHENLKLMKNGDIYLTLKMSKLHSLWLTFLFYNFIFFSPVQKMQTGHKNCLDKRTDRRTTMFITMYANIFSGVWWKTFNKHLKLETFVCSKV